MTEKRYVLCRPQGGLNDTLCQIEICRAYAARYGRILIVDGRRSGVLGEFGNYFRMAGDGHIFDMTDKAVPDIDSLDCYPPEVQGRVSTLRSKRNLAPGWRCAVDLDTEVALRFSLDRDHPQTLLLHQQGGGGTNSFDLINRLTLVPWLAQQARDKIAQLPVGYSALHVRNTDYRTDIGMVLRTIRGRVAGQDLLVCSDDPAVLPALRSGLPDTRIHQITTLVYDGGRPQHKTAGVADGTVRHHVATGSIVDLCAMAAASTLYVSVLQSREGNESADFTGINRLSGYSKLAVHLCENKKPLRRLLGGFRFGLNPWPLAGSVRIIQPR